VEPASASSTPAKPPGFWQRRVRDPILRQLTQGVGPERLALTLAVGSALALFPILGTTTLLCFIAGLVLRFNQPIIQVVNYLGTLVYAPAVFLQFQLGAALFGRSPTELSFEQMGQLFRSDLAEFASRFGDAALHTIIAWGLLAPAWIAIVYLGLRPMLRRAMPASRQARQIE
jgi:uncharacterized protein (DUF2062 family)